MKRLTLGLDLGTSAVKVVALGSDDRVLGEGSMSFGTDTTQSHQAEQQTADWLQAAAGAMRALASDLAPRLGAEWAERITAIGLTGQLPTLVCLGEGKPLAAAITWKDGRADA